MRIGQRTCATAGVDEVGHSRRECAVRKAADELVGERFLLQVDADAFVSAAEASNILQ